MTTREEDVLVLYASQRGSAESRANLIGEQIPEKLSPEAIQKFTGSDTSVTVKPKILSLNEFLTDEDGKWTRLVIIVVSSFGTGQAPMNGRRFRTLCDGWISDFTSDPAKDKFLTGLRFALLGLGDSYYKTYQRNPKTTEEALTLAGATLVGERGEADADKGAEDQLKAMDDWTAAIWPELANVLITDPSSEEQLAEMQRGTQAS